MVCIVLYGLTSLSRNHRVLCWSAFAVAGEGGGRYPLPFPLSQIPYFPSFRLRSVDIFPHSCECVCVFNTSKYFRIIHCCISLITLSRFSRGLLTLAPDVSWRLAGACGESALACHSVSRWKIGPHPNTHFVFRFFIYLFLV